LDHDAIPSDVKLLCSLKMLFGSFLTSNFKTKSLLSRFTMGRDPKSKPQWELQKSKCYGSDIDNRLGSSDI